MAHTKSLEQIEGLGTQLSIFVDLSIVEWGTLFYFPVSVISFRNIQEIVNLLSDYLNKRNFFSTGRADICGDA